MYGMRMKSVPNKQRVWPISAWTANVVIPNGICIGTIVLIITAQAVKIYTLKCILLNHIPVISNLMAMWIQRWGFRLKRYSDYVLMSMQTRKLRAVIEFVHFLSLF